MGDKKKTEDFVSGFKDATSGVDLSEVAKKASEVIGAGVKKVGDAATAVGTAASQLLGGKTDSGGFLGDTDRYKTSVAKKK